MNNLIFDLLYRDDTYMRAIAKGDNYVVFVVPDGTTNGFLNRILKRTLSVSANCSIIHLNSGITLRIERDGLTVVFLCEYPVIDDIFDYILNE